MTFEEIKQQEIDDIAARLRSSASHWQQELDNFKRLAEEIANYYEDPERIKVKELPAPTIGSAALLSALDELRNRLDRGPAKKGRGPSQCP